MEFFELWEDYDLKCFYCGRKIELKEDNLDYCRFCDSFVKFGDEFMKSLFIVDLWGEEKEFLEFFNIYNVFKVFGRIIEFFNYYESVVNMLILDRSRIEDLQIKKKEIERG